jgi:uncharacterized protein involved in exopolysaccharide biosynthesis
LIRGTPHLPAAAPDPLPFDLPPLEPEEQSRGGLTRTQIWMLVRARLVVSVATFVALLAASYVAIKLMPKTYEATAALIVNADNSDPLAGRNLGLGLNYTFFPTQVELINNSVILGPVIDRLGLRNDPQFNGGMKPDAEGVTEVVLTNLRNSMGVRQGGTSQLLYITAAARDPIKAAAITNAIAEEYLNQSRQRINAPAIERASRYSAQLAELKEKVDIAQANVAAFRQKYDMADLKDSAPAAKDTEAAPLQDLQARLMEAQNARRQLEAKVGATGVDGASADGAEVIALRARLAALETQLAESRASLGPRHPKIVQLQSEIASTKAALQSSAGAALARAKELESKYVASVEQERDRLLHRRILQDQGAKLLMAEQLAKDNYAVALRGYDQVRFASEGNYQDVSLVSRASPPLKPSRPNKTKYFLVAMLASLALAFGGPFAYELLIHRRVRCRDDLERGFKIVTLAEFGPIASEQAA